MKLRVALTANNPSEHTCHLWHDRKIQFHTLYHN